MSTLQGLGNHFRRQQRRAVRRAQHVAKATDEGIRDARHAIRRAGKGVQDKVVNAFKRVLRRARRPIRTALRRKTQLQEQWEFNRVEWGVEAEVRSLVSRERLLVAGPWISEVGFEALYWVPFLQWLKVAMRIEPDRMVAVSRGGVASWYAGVASRYIETWDLMPPHAFAHRNAERETVKHLGVSKLDEAILEAVARRIGTHDFDVLHPSLMYRLFTLFWSGQRAMGFVDTHTRFTKMEPQELIDPGLLPREYVAVKLYAAQSLPDTSDTRRRLHEMIATLARRVPVVLLDTGLALEDDHADYDLLADANVVSAKSWMTPQNNLGVQTQIAAGASAFVGTCGSLTWLIPRLGVDTSALYVDPKWLHAHLSVAMRAYHRLDAGRFAAADLRAIDPMAAGTPVTSAAEARR